MSTEQMRKDLGAWYTGPNPVHLERNGPHYKYMPANVAWVTWQAAPATQPQAPQGAVIPESAILQRAKYHAYEADDCGPADYQIFDLETDECGDCIEVLIVRADAVAPKTETPEGDKQ